MEPLIALMQYWIQTAGALGVFGASVFEEVFSIIPSSVVQTGAGVFIMADLPFSLGSVARLVFEIAVPSALGVTVGSLVYVWLARRIGILAIEKYGKWIGVSMEHIRKLERKLEGSRWDDVAFVALRAFPAVPAVALAVYAGIIEMPWKKYIVLTFFGVLIRATALGFAGWMFRESFSSWERFFSRNGVILYLVAGAALLGYLAYSFYRTKKKTDD